MWAVTKEAPDIVSVVWYTETILNFELVGLRMTVSDSVPDGQQVSVPVTWLVAHSEHHFPAPSSKLCQI